MLRATIVLVVTCTLTPARALAAAHDVGPTLPDAPFAESGAGEASSGGAAASKGGSAAASEAPREGEAPDVGDADLDRDGEDQGAEDDVPGDPLRALSCLEGEGGNDRDGSRRGVQKRDFLKVRRAEIAILGGYHASDALSSTYVYGGAVSFFPAEDFGVELMLTRNPMTFRLEEPFTSFQGERHFQPSTAWNALGALSWSPIHAKLRFSERRITHGDLLLILGGGKTFHDSVQGLTMQAGVELKLYFTRFVSMRLDVRDLMIPQEVLGRGRTTHNLVTTVGLCVWVPG